MAKISIPCLVGKKNKAGITSWFWQPSATLARAGFKSQPLGKDAVAAMRRAQDLNAEVAAWKAGGTTRPAVTPRKMPGTFAALIERYRREKMNGIDPLTGKRFIRESTAATYDIQLRRLEAWAGKHPIAYITPQRIKVLRNSLVHPETGIGHSAAHNTLKVLRQIFSFAESEDLIPKNTNPATKFGLGAPPSRTGVWEEEDEAAFIAAAYHLNRPSMALAMKLAIYTAQREGDLIDFNEFQLQPLEIHDRFVIERLGDGEGVVRGWKMGQSKSGGKTQMEIPIEPGLLAELQAALRNNRARDRAARVPRLVSYALIDDATGLPWNLCEGGSTRPRGGRLAKLKEGQVRPIQVRAEKGAQRAFIRIWRKVIDQAIEMTGRDHMANLVWHDLRRTRVVRLRRRGMPVDQIASITGHSPKSIEMMLKVYGPIDATMTAAAIASALPAPTIDEQSDHSNNSAKSA